MDEFMNRSHASSFVRTSASFLCLNSHEEIRTMLHKSDSETLCQYKSKKPTGTVNLSFLRLLTVPLWLFFKKKSVSIFRVDAVRH